MRLLSLISQLGVVLMVLSPVVALRFGWDVFFPVTITSLIGAVIGLVFRALPAHREADQITAELIRDLVSADQRRRELVLSEFSESERKLFSAETALSGEKPAVSRPGLNQHSRDRLIGFLGILLKSSLSKTT